MNSSARSVGRYAVTAAIMAIATVGIWTVGAANAQPDGAIGKVEAFEAEVVPSIQGQTSRSVVAQRSAPPVPRGIGPASYSNATAITITDCPITCPSSGQAASLYPSSITVAGETGVVERVSVTINGFSHAFPADVDFLLVSPSGRKSVIMSDFGGGSPGVSNINITLDDYADQPIPSTVAGNTGVPFVTGTYRPANSGATDLFPAPAPAVPYTYTLSAFNGDNPNGTWSLYIIDDANLDGGSISGGWTLTFDSRPPPPAAGDILISEFRTRGAGIAPPGSDGSADEFIELYNNTDASITLIDAIPGADPTSPGGAGWRIGGAQGAAETTFVVIPQTLSTAGPIALPPRGYFLISTQPTTPSPAGNTYSLATYPTGTGITASGTANISLNPASATVGFLPDDVGLAVFSTVAAISDNRLDSVGYSSVANPDYKEGAGLLPASGITVAGQHSWVRRAASGFPQDTGDNLQDFVLVDTTAATLNGVAAVLGAPGPQRGPTMTAFTITSAPLHTVAGLDSSIIDVMQPVTGAPNQVVDPTPVVNGANGTIKFRRRYTNTSGHPFVAMRFRIVEISTNVGGVVPAGFADLRVLSSPQQTITLTDATTVTSQALNLQAPPTQAMGGGLNSSLGQPIITTTAPLADGASTVVEFNFGVQTNGNYSIKVLAEGLTVPPLGGASALDTFELLPSADLGITKSNGVSTSTPGTNTTYTITASNAGPDPVTGATVTDTFPASLTCNWTCVGAGGGTCTAAGSGNIGDTVNLPVGGSTTYTATCAIAPSATGTLVNTATVASSLADPTPGNNSATDTDTLAPSANLSITKTDGVTTVTPGGSTTYTITASNAGPSNAPGAMVADTFPASLTCNWTCVGAGGGTCTASGSGSIADTVNLPAGGSVTYSAACTISGSASGTLSNTATVSTPPGVTDPAPGNNSATDTNTVLLPGNLTITPTSLAFGSLTVGTTSAAQIVTLGNNGGSPLNVTALSAAAAPFALSGGTCGAVPITLAAGANCTLSYTFTPTSSGAVNQTLTVTSSSTGSGNIGLSGTGLALGNLTLSPASLAFGSLTVGTTSAAQTVTLGNNGGSPLNVTALDAAVAPFALSGSTCGTVPITLAAGASCTLSYTFTPTNAVQSNRILTVTSSSTGSGSIALSGTGLTPGNLTVSPTSVAFGSLTVGTTSAAQTVTLGNDGESALNVTALNAATAPFALSGGTCGAVPITIAAGANCTLSYTFTPTSAGAANQTLAVTSSSTGSSSIGLSGTGLTPGNLTLSPTSLAFGSLTVGTTSAAQTVTLGNDGESALNVTALSAATAPFALSGGTCGAVPITIAAGANCTLSYTFTPTSSGAANQTLAVTSSSTGSGSIGLSGTGLTPGNLTVSPTSVDFGEVVVGSASAALVVTIGNDGESALNVTALSAAAAPFTLSGGTCGAVPITLTAGTNCTLSYTFTPTSAGAASQTLVVTSSSTGSGVFVLSGEGIQGVIGVLSGNLDFGNQNLGTSGQQAVMITNTGSAALSVTALSAVTAPFALTGNGTCGSLPFTLVAGASCTVIYSFAPTYVGDFNQALTITSDVGVVAVTLRGVGLLPPPLFIPANNIAGLLLLLLGMLATVVLINRRG